MRYYPAVLLAFALQGATARAAIDFTPTSGERVVEGIVFKEIIFHENGHEITYEAPRGWTYTGDAAQFRLVPPNLSQAQGTIEQSPLPAPQPLDESTLKQLQQTALTSVPAGAQNVALVAEENNPLRINKEETYETIVGYNFFGQDYELGVIYANLPDTQLRFRVAARKADFEKVHREFRASLFTLNWQ